MENGVEFNLRKKLFDDLFNTLNEARGGDEIDNHTISGTSKQKANENPPRW